MDKIRKFFDRITGMKLHYKMFLVYILGGALPLILIALYLVQGISKILIEQGEVTELEMIIRKIDEQRKKAENPPAEYFLMMAEVGDLEGIRDGVEKYRTYCIKNRLKEADVKMQVLYNLITVRNGVEKKYGSCQENFEEQIETLNTARSLGRVMELYAGILQNICIQIGQDSPDTVIGRMHYYMEKNYGQEMKLESFA